MLIMIQAEIDKIVLELCNQAGRGRSVEFHFAPPLNAQRLGGEWEISCFGSRSVTLRYWKDALSSNSTAIGSFSSEMPPTQEDKSVYVTEVSRKIEELLAGAKAVQRGINT